MTRKGEKRVSSTPALSQSEVEEWTGQSPSAESWLVPQRQGSISERDKQEHKWEEGDQIIIKTARKHANWIQASQEHI